MINHVMGFLFSPQSEWTNVRQKNQYSGGVVYVLLMALLPTIAWYYGVAETGWQVADGEFVKLTEKSAMQIVSLFYLAMVLSVFCIGYFVHWMASSYGSDSSITKGITLAGYCATPLFITGLVGFYPILWLDMLIAVLAIGHALYLLYKGIPIVMDIPPEQGFLFASAILAVCLVILMAMMGGTVIMWELGVTPVFID